MRRYDESIEVLKKGLELEAAFPEAHLELGRAYAAKAMYREAIAEYQRANKLGDLSYSLQINSGAAYAKMGERAQALSILKQLQTSSYVSPAQLAILYAALDRREEAFASLMKAYAEHDLWLQSLGVEPNYDSLRSDPRFADSCVRSVSRNKDEAQPQCSLVETEDTIYLRVPVPIQMRSPIKEKLMVSFVFLRTCRSPTLD